MDELTARENPSEKKVGSKLSVLLVFLTCVYVAFLLYQAVFLNYQTNQKIRILKNDLSNLDKDQDRLSSLIAYYKTGAFQELEARKKLGLKMPGEKTIQVSIVEETVKTDAAITENQNIANAIAQESNWEKWLDYLKGQQVQ